MSKLRPSEGEISTLSAEQRNKLEKVQRLLLNVRDPVISPRVQLHGYDNDEHQLGWRLFVESSGGNIPLDAVFSARKQAEIPNEERSRSIFRELDQFENRWFPRVEAALKRFIAPKVYDQFKAAFFQDLSMQPEGPAVVGSVTKLLDRTEALATSAVEGAAAAFASLVKRGLDDDFRAHIRSLLARAQRLDWAAPPTTVDVAALSQAQQEAYRQLVDWYKDWATTFRQELDHRSLVRLGLRAPKPPKKPSPDEAPPTA
jgi:hypothetical protein